ncbi:MAG TPA: phospholipase D family protein [Gammaproteobacteria bacterium]|nr:phospholipase D family protein [Gammaproteobacteria bacterium]
MLRVLILGNLLSLFLSTLTACAPVQPRPELPFETAVQPAAGGPLDNVIERAEASHPGVSAFRLVVDGPEAFMLRVRSAVLAARSIDVQTYLWHEDDTGIYLANTLLEAADRGVKVRLLLDDMDGRALNEGLAALAAHPNIHVRTFNPFRSRSGMLGLVGESMANFKRVNRRMHNKSWIVDNRIAVTGGRNIGDEYFGASDEMNFFDLDFAMIGPVVREASDVFDRYWNSPYAYPMEVLDPASVSREALKRLRTEYTERSKAVAQSRYAAALRMDDVIKLLIEGHWPMEWASRYLFVADDPSKVVMDRKDAQRTQVGAALRTVMNELKNELTIVSPYFIPGKRLTEQLVASVREGKRVSVLTNSLAANDVAAVHGGYSRYRKPLLAGGVELWELKPQADGQVRSSLFGSSGASLHTKALLMDGNIAFVGSYNLDPRSTWLNCEQGVMVENPKLAAQLESIFADYSAGDHAWKLSLNKHGLNWDDGNKRFDSDPQASLGRRFKAWMARVFHLEAQL